MILAVRVAAIEMGFFSAMEMEVWTRGIPPHTYIWWAFLGCVLVAFRT